MLYSKPADKPIMIVKESPEMLLGRMNIIMLDIIGTNVKKSRTKRFIFTESELNVKKTVNILIPHIKIVEIIKNNFVL